MRGRAKGTRERILLLAHQNEAMARQKVLRSPEHYLAHRSRPAPAAPGPVVAMFSRMQRAGLNVAVRRIERPE